MPNSIPTGNYMFKVNSKNTRKKCKICSKLTLKTPEWSHQNGQTHSSKSSVVSRRIVWVWLNILMESFWCLYCWLWTYFTPCSVVSLVNFEQVNAGWDDSSFQLSVSSKTPNQSIIQFTMKHASQLSQTSMAFNTVLNKWLRMNPRLPSNLPS